MCDDFVWGEGRRLFEQNKNIPLLPSSILVSAFQETQGNISLRWEKGVGDEGLFLLSTFNFLLLHCSHKGFKNGLENRRGERLRFFVGERLAPLLEELLEDEDRKLQHRSINPLLIDQERAENPFRVMCQNHLEAGDPIHKLMMRSLVELFPLNEGDALIHGFRCVRLFLFGKILLHHFQTFLIHKGKESEDEDARAVSSDKCTNQDEEARVCGIVQELDDCTRDLVILLLCLLLFPSQLLHGLRRSGKALFRLLTQAFQSCTLSLAGGETFKATEFRHGNILA